MSNKTVLAITVALFLGTIPRLANAAAFNLSVKGSLLNSFGGTCGDNLGDTYDTFCPQGGCGCKQYDDPDKNHFNGNLAGSGKSVTVHFTENGGTHTGDHNGTGDGCAPVFGEVQLEGTKGTETIFFNGSICIPVSNQNAKGAFQPMVGGWEINSSSKNIKARGSFTGKFQWNKIGFSMIFKGETQ